MCMHRTFWPKRLCPGHHRLPILRAICQLKDHEQHSEAGQKTIPNSFEATLQNMWLTRSQIYMRRLELTGSPVAGTQGFMRVAEEDVGETISSKDSIGDIGLPAESSTTMFSRSRVSCCCSSVKASTRAEGCHFCVFDGSAALDCGFVPAKRADHCFNVYSAL